MCTRKRTKCGFALNPEAVPGVATPTLLQTTSPVLCSDDSADNVHDLPDPTEYGGGRTCMDNTHGVHGLNNSNFGTAQEVARNRSHTATFADAAAVSMVHCSTPSSGSLLRTRLEAVSVLLQGGPWHAVHVQPAVQLQRQVPDLCSPHPFRAPHLQQAAHQPLEGPFCT